MHDHPRRWRLHRLARACLLATLGLGAGALHGAGGTSRLDSLLGCATGGAASFVERLSEECSVRGLLGVAGSWASIASRAPLTALAARAAAPRPLELEIVRSYFGPGDAWANPLLWVAPGEPMHGDVVRIGWTASVTYAPVLFPNAVFRRVEVGREFLASDPPPANGFVITPSSITGSGFYVDRGAGSFAPALMQTDASRTLRTDAMQVGLGNNTEGALLISAGAVEVGGPLTLGGYNGPTQSIERGGLGYLRLASNGAGPPTLSVATDLLLGGTGGQAFVQMEAGRLAVGGSLLVTGESVPNRFNNSYLNLVGGTLSVGQDSVLGRNTWRGELWAGVRHGAARHEVGRDLLIGDFGGFADYETQAGAVLTVGRDLLLGSSGFGHGTLRHGGGEILVARDLIVGAADAGSGVLQVGGAAKIQVGGRFVVGGAGHGELQVAGGPWSLASDLTVGSGGVGLATVSSELSLQGRLVLGENRGQAQFTVDPGARLVASQVLQSADAALGSSFEARAGSVVSLGGLQTAQRFALDGARLDVAADWLAGGAAGGIVDLQGGATVAVGRDLVLGSFGLPTWRQRDATLSVGRDLVVGSAAGSIALLELRGGAQVDVAQAMVVGGAGKGSLTMDGAGALSRLNVRTLAIGGSVFGAAELAAGELVASDSIRVDANGSLSAGAGARVRTGQLVVDGGRVTLAQRLDVSAGSFAQGAQILTLNAGARLEVPELFVGTGGSVALDSTAELVAATTVVDGGTVTGTFNNRGVLSLRSGNLDALALANQGTLLLSQTPLQLLSLHQGAGTLTIGAGESVRTLAGLSNAGEIRVAGSLGVVGDLSQSSGSGARLALTGGTVRVDRSLLGGGLDDQSIELGAGRLEILGELRTGHLGATGGDLSVGAGAQVVRSFEQSAGTLTIGTQWVLAGPQPIAATLSGGLLQVGSARLGGSGASTTLLQTGGRLASSGIIELQADATWNFQGGSLDAAGLSVAAGNGPPGPLGTSTGPASVGGRSRPNASGAGGLLLLDDATPRGLTIDGGPVTNSGIVRWSRGNVSGTSRLVNNADGLFEVSAGGVLNGGGFSFDLPVDNFGHMTIAADSWQIFKGRIDNRGTFVSGARSLTELRGGGGGTGSFRIGGELRLTGFGPHTFAGEVSTLAGGKLMVLAPTAVGGFGTHAGRVESYAVTGLVLDGAAWRMGAGSTLFGSFALASGSLDFDAGSTLEPFAVGHLYGQTLDLAGGALRMNAGSRLLNNKDVRINGTAMSLSTGSPVTFEGLRLSAGSLDGTDDKVLVNGSLGSALDWDGGTLAGPGRVSVGFFQGANLFGPQPLTLQTTLALNGRTRIDGATVLGNGVLEFGDGGIDTRLSGAFSIAPTVRIAFASPVSAPGAGQVGSFLGPVDVSAISRLVAQDGRTRLAGGGRSLGELRVQAGATAEFAGSSEFLFEGGSAAASGAGTFEITGGTVRFAGGARYGGFAAERLLGGTLHLDAGSRYSFNDGLLVDGAELRVSTGLGDFVLPADTVLRAGALGGSDARRVAAGRSFSWQGGAIATGALTSVAAGAQMRIEGPQSKTLAGELRNDGTLRWLGGGGIDGAGRITNAAGALLEIAGSGAMSPAVVNEGLARVLAGAQVSMGGSLDNRATLDVEAGGRLNVTGSLLNESNGSFSGGVWNIAGTLSHAASPVTTLDADVRLVGAQAFLRSAGSVDLLDSVTRVAPGGRLLFEGGRTLAIAGNRTLDVDGRLEVGAGSVLSAGPGRLGGAGTVQVLGGGRLTWTSANLNATGSLRIDAGGLAVLSDATSNHEHVGRTIVNQGTVQWTAGDLRAGNGSSILNAGLWEDQAATGHSLNNFGGTQLLTFANTGTYRKTGAGTTQFHGQRLDNSGRVELLDGALLFNAGGVNRGGGVIDIAPGRTLTLSSGTFAFEDGSAVTGAGALVFDGGNSPPVATIDGRVSFANLTLRGGTVAGTHTLDGRISWTRAALGAGGTTTIASTGVLLLSDATSNHEHVGRAIVNQGTVQWSTGDLRGGNGSSITNAGLWEDQASSGHSVNNFSGTQLLTFTNTGTYRKTGAGTTQFHGQRLDNTGRVEVQQGTLQLNAGAVQMQGGQLGGGQWEVGPGAALVIPGVTSLPVNAASVSLRGAGSVFAPINALADNRGEFRIGEGRNFSTAGNLLNSGLLFAGTGSVLTVNGSLDSSGTLGGGGEIRVLGQAHVTGAVNPGSSPGVLTFAGNLSLDPGSVLNIEIEGLGAGSGYDRLVVSGRATLGGALAVHLPSIFDGLAGARFTILGANEVVGQFAGLADGDFVNVDGGRFVIDYRPDAVVLERFTAAVPEPQTYAMLLAGLAVLGAMARRRRARA